VFHAIQFFNQMKRFCAVFSLLWCWWVSAAEVIPPAPTRYLNDYAHVVSAATAERLNRTLEDFEKTSSSQIVVAVFPKMQSDSSMEDYTFRVKESWKVGQKGKNNGAVLFVFIQDRKMFLQVGYGLEGALPDALCKQIIEYEIKPRFKTGDYDGGLSAGVAAILAATKGEYRGTGRTVADQQGNVPGLIFLALFGFAFLMIIFTTSRRTGSTMYYGSGWSTRSGWSGWSSGSGGGGYSGGGGGGFSGGGGSGGGGGAGGSW
jgi:uncharacterized protein